MGSGPTQEELKGLDALAADPNKSIEELRGLGVSDEEIARLKGVPVETIKLNDQLPANAQAGASPQMPGVANVPGVRTPVLQAIDANPFLGSLDEQTKLSIANNPNSPLNPLNPNFTLGSTTDIGREAQTEKVLQDALAQQQQEKIGQFATEFSASAEAKRKALADRLAEQTAGLSAKGEEAIGRYAGDLATSRQKTFEQANPYLLEDLNRRGLLTSETAVGDAQARALAELQAQDESKLGQARLGLADQLASYEAMGNENLGAFEQGAFGNEQSIRGEGLNTLLSGGQGALEDALGLKRNELESKYNMAQAQADRQYASELARQQRKGSMGRILASGGKQS